MENRKAYTAISVVMGIVFLNSLFWTGKFLLSEGKHFYGSGYWINTFFTFLGIAGLVLFAASKFRNSILLRIFMCKVIISLPETIWYEYLFFSGDRVKDFSDPMIYIGVVLTMMMAVACIAGLWMLTKQRVPKLQHYMIGQESAVAEFTPASGWSRLANYLVDISFIYYTVYSLIQTMRYSRFASGGYGYEREDFSAGFVPVIVLLLYYIILEGIFNTTAGKCATNTVIVNSSGEVPSVGQRLGRTLCRFIPLETITFLVKGNRGWHDSITNTYVVPSADRYEEKEIEDELAGFLQEQV